MLVSRTPSPLASPGVLRSSPTLSEASDPVVGGGAGRRASEEVPILLVSTGQTSQKPASAPAPVFNLLHALRPGFILGKLPVPGSTVGTPNPSPEQGVTQDP